MQNTDFDAIVDAVIARLRDSTDRIVPVVHPEPPPPPEPQATIQRLWGRIQMLERENQKLWAAVDEAVACLVSEKKSVAESYTDALKALTQWEINSLDDERRAG